MAGRGRPTKYTPELLAKAREYLEVWHTEDPVPTVVGLALYIGANKKTCYEWIKDSDKAEFSDILAEVEQTQEQMLVRGGISGAFNAPITKMMMTKHGYSDKVEQAHTSPDGSMATPTTIVLTGPTGLPD